MDKIDNEIAKRIRGDVTRYQRRVPEVEGKDYVQSFVNIILAYLNSNRDVEYSGSLVPLCAPFIYVLETECDAYFCFERLMQALGTYYSIDHVKDWLIDSVSGRGIQFYY
jgi:hypothetical protein